MRSRAAAAPLFALGLLLAAPESARADAAPPAGESRTRAKPIGDTSVPYPEGAKSYSKTKPMRIEEFEAEKAWWGSEADGFAARVENEQAWKVDIDAIKAAGYNLDQKNPHTPDAVSHDSEELLRDYARLQAEARGIRDQLKALLGAALTGQ